MDYATVIVPGSPGVNATRVGASKSVNVTFGEAVTGVDGATFKLKQGSKTVSAVVGHDAASRTAALDPLKKLASGKKYAVVLSSGISDGVGNCLAPTNRKFTTR